MVTTLDQDTASQLLDLLLHRPTEDKYMAIKARLLKTFGLTCRVRANKLLNMHDLEDKMPSALMDEMLYLIDGHQPCILFEQLFLNQMSADPIHLQLTNADFADHKPLTLTFAKVSAPWSAQQQWHLAAVPEYTTCTCIKHVAVKSNLVADAL